MITVPDPVHRSAESQGPIGRAWLAALPGLVEELCHAWQLTLGEVFEGGKWAYVARVQVADRTDAHAHADGITDAVLKVALPTQNLARQIETLTAADGRGYVRVYRADPARDALLMEPLGPMLSAAGRPIEHILDVLAATLLEAWQAPPPTGHPRLDVAAGLIGVLDAPLPPTPTPTPIEPHPSNPAPSYLPQLISLARTLIERRAAAFNPDTYVLCHGDPHADNALAVPSPRSGAQSGYVFVDPDGFLADPTYDLGVSMRGWTDQVLTAADPVALTRSWSTRLAEATNLDEQAIWEWALIQRVTTGLHLLRHGHTAEGQAFLASAERLA
ncbi:MAG TPA: hypothetical protein VGX23_23790 [Actinocrinis sp.]|nr:hypothetical protein [Actinocrinis sp.]